MRALDPEVPVFAVQTLEQMVAGSRAAFMRRYPAYLTGVFACVALLLALVGIYGVVSYSVAQRTHEIAVRVALGARTRDVLRLVLGHGLLLALGGIAVGAAGALALTRLISGLLFGVSAADPSVYAVVCAAARRGRAPRLPRPRAPRDEGGPDGRASLRMRNE